MGILDFFNTQQNAWNAQQANSPYTPDMRLNAGMQSLGLLGGTMMAAGAPTTDPGAYGRIMGQGMAQRGPMMQQSLDQQLQQQDMMAEREREAAMQAYMESPEFGAGMSPEQMEFIRNAPPEIGMRLLGDSLFAQSDPLTDNMLGDYVTADGQVLTMPHADAIAQNLTPYDASDLAQTRLIESRIAGRNVNTTNIDATPLSDGTRLQNAIADVQAGQFDRTVQAADAAYATLDNIENIRAINLQTGSLTSVKGDVAGIMRAVGLGDLADEWISIDPSDVETYASFANRAALSQKDDVLGGGILSDSDIVLLQSLASNPDNQPLANAIILGAMERAAKLKIAERNALEEWVGTYGTMGEKISAEEAVIEGSEGKTFNQWWGERRGELAAEFRSQDIGANASLPSMNLEINGQAINQMTPDAILGTDRSGLSTEELEALRQRIIILQEQGLL